MPRTKEMQFAKGKKYTPSVFDVFFFTTDGDLMFVAQCNTDASIEITSNKTEKKGGVGGSVLWVINSDRAVTAKFTALDLQTNYIAANVGSTVQVGKNAYLANKNLPAVNGVVTLPNIPSDGKIRVNVNGSYISLEATTTSVDLSSCGVESGCVNIVYFYEADGVTVPIPTDAAPTVGKIVYQTPMFISGLGEVGTCGWVFPNYQLDGTFSHVTNTSDSSSIEISGSALKSDEALTACSQGSTGNEYGYYFETYLDPTALYTFGRIVATPDEMELSLANNDKEIIKVYGKKGAGFGNVTIEHNDILFSSSDPSIAVVDKFGEVSPVAVGNAIITCAYKQSGEIGATLNVAGDEQESVPRYAQTVKVNVSVID